MYSNNPIFNTRYYSTYANYDAHGVVKCPFTTGPGQTIIKPFVIHQAENDTEFVGNQIVNPNTLSNAYPMSCLDSTYLIPLVPNHKKKQ